MSQRQKEKPPINELPFNQAAQEIGLALSQQKADLNRLMEIETPYGTLKRIGEPRATREGAADIPPSHQHKKHLFEGKIEVLDLPIIVIYYAEPFYVQDPNYFRRAYENSRDVYGGKATPFTERKLVPWLYGHHDETMTLIIEKGVRSLEFYYRSTNQLRVRKTIRTALELMHSVWEESKRNNQEWPRYVTAFLTPEYDYLRAKELKNYLKDPTTISLYQETQRLMQAHLQSLSQSHFPRGFGFPDVKADNLLEDQEGNVLFIDIAKPAFAYHWLTTLGQFYQAVAKKAPRSIFAKILKERISQSLKSEAEQKLAVQLFALGRMNRLLIGCTLRNISYIQEIGLPVDEETIRSTLTQVRALMEASSIEEVAE